MSRFDQEHLVYYEQELALLREMGAAFAEKYPKVASRLSLSPDVSPDPHTERLLESFAFLTSYLKKDINNQFPRVASTLLNTLQPQLVAPLPPMSIAELSLDLSKGKSTTGYPVKRDFPLFTRAAKGEVCRFQTCYDMTLWPFEITNVAIEPANMYDFANSLTPYPFVMRISLKTDALPLNKYDVDNLQFYINSDSVMANMLYEAIFLTDHKVGLVNPETKEFSLLPEGSIESVGFGDHEHVLPDFPQALPAYRLLQEFFAFPNKFLFFNVKNISFDKMTKEASILIPMASYDDSFAKNIIVTKDTIKLGCTPIINLFPKITDPIDFDKKRTEYALAPDVRRTLTTEIHSIQEVVSSVPNSSKVEKVSAYFSYNHEDIQDQKKSYWYARRTAAMPGIPGTQMSVSFVDLDFSVKSPPQEVIYARTLCTNRNLAIFIQPGSILEADRALPTKEIKCLHQPTPTVYNSADGADQWKLISQLSLDYLSLSSGAESLKAFQELLTLYSGDIAATMPTGITHIMALSVDKIVRRIGQDAWRGMVKGTGVTMTLDTQSFARKDALLFSAVLSHFLNLYCTINTFVELAIKKPDESEIWKRWAPRIGAHPLL